MPQSQYNPGIHHRRSIRLKSHDYAGGGLYYRIGLSSLGLIRILKSDLLRTHSQPRETL